MRLVLPAYGHRPVRIRRLPSGVTMRDGRRSRFVDPCRGRRNACRFRRRRGRGSWRRILPSLARRSDGGVRAYWRIDSSNFEFFDLNLHWLQRHLGVLAGQLVGGHALNFLGGKRRWQLLDLASKSAGELAHLHPMTAQLSGQGWWVRLRHRRCRWQSRSGSCPRRFSRTAYRTGPGG